MEDFRGQQLIAGDHIVYARRQGSSLWLEEGTVVIGSGAYDGKLRVRNAKTGRQVAITNLSTVIKLGGDGTSTVVEDPYPVNHGGKYTDGGCDSCGGDDESGGDWSCERPAGHTGQHMAWDSHPRRDGKGRPIALYPNGVWD